MIKTTLTKETFLKIIEAIKEDDMRKDKISTHIEEFIDGYAVLKESPVRICLYEILRDTYGDEGLDLVYWWLYENVEKVLYDANTGEILYRLNTEEDLSNYLSTFFCN